MTSGRTTARQAVQVLQGPSMCNLANILFGVDTLKDIIGNNDNDTLRVEEICNSIDNTIHYYADKHRDGVNKRTQSSISLSHVSSPRLPTRLSIISTDS